MDKTSYQGRREDVFFLWTSLLCIILIWDSGREELMVSLFELCEWKKKSPMMCEGFAGERLLGIQEQVNNVSPLIIM